ASAALPPEPGFFSARGASPALELVPTRDVTPEGVRPPGNVADDPALVHEAARLEPAPPPGSASVETGPDGIAAAGSLSVALDPAPAPWRA
ncbi:hypothetical protein ABTH97_19885, partial [Acinetobacter baumannii]